MRKANAMTNTTQTHLKAVEDIEETAPAAESTDASEEQFLNITEATEYTNRSRGFILKEENKKILEEGGAVFSTTAGVGSRIPKSLLDSLGWKQDKQPTKRRNRAAASATSSTEALDAELEEMLKEQDAARETVISLGTAIKAKRAEIAKITRDAEREAKKAESAKRTELAREEKALAAAMAAVEAAQARLAELKASQS